MATDDLGYLEDDAEVMVQGEEEEYAEGGEEGEGAEEGYDEGGEEENGEVREEGEYEEYEGEAEEDGELVPDCSLSNGDQPLCTKPCRSKYAVTIHIGARHRYRVCAIQHFTNRLMQPRITTSLIAIHNVVVGTL